jgi:hypothetical protein
VGLESYTSVLCENGFDVVSDLQLIKEDDFRTMGFKLGHSRRLTAKLQERGLGYSSDALPPSLAESPILSIPRLSLVRLRCLMGTLCLIVKLLLPFLPTLQLRIPRELRLLLPQRRPKFALISPRDGARDLLVDFCTRGVSVSVHLLAWLRCASLLLSVPFACPRPSLFQVHPSR